MVNSEAVVQKCSVKNVLLKIPQIHRRTPQDCNFIKKETLVQVFSCEFCEIFKDTFFTEYFWTTASIHLEIHLKSVFPAVIYLLKVNNEKQ